MRQNKYHRNDDLMLMLAAAVAIAMLFIIGLSGCAGAPAIAPTPKVPPVISTAPEASETVRSDPETKGEEVETTVALPWDGRHPESPKWSQHVLRVIGELGIADSAIADAADVCPAYPRLSADRRKVFWANLVAVMTRYESNFKPETKYQESFNDSKGKPVISRGLLQISVESANQSAYGCGASETLLHDPEFNLSCGLKIIRHWVTKDGQAMGSPGKNLGCARYWSVCRTTSGSYAPIRDHLRSLPVCQT